MWLAAGEPSVTSTEAPITTTYLGRKEDRIGKKDFAPDGTADCLVRLVGLPSDKEIRKATLTGPRKGIWLDHPNPDRWLLKLTPEDDVHLLAFSFWAPGPHRLALEFADGSKEEVAFHVYFPGSPFFEADLEAAQGNVRVIQKQEPLYTEVMTSVLKNLLASGEFQGD